MYNSITAFGAKTHFSKLLDRASKGEEILITRRGKVAAKIVPINTEYDIETSRIAAIRLRKLAREINLQPSDFGEWLNYRNEGKK
ncbi:MAG: type II toxin-antitoxin system Phd/YefM family antitoxin [Rickettsia endosymbiont of Ixodes persulcatus]|nr:type II toxin-antitoxin system Phd/YefM family antitoxin [Rickettsia endosymbiont of Ixodes persulcatus]MCZ6902938.1 type II toxin-antitoxin system Phd/YefM family antitoxin [Rickettsia endosymbiont of Ixodes persulcatus]MCZ6909487.1 type II toxin-antitoxin system Phd/YefM family antitoxin [Rickettsia endosymbiont of Ixodes persulcatus]MCZ6910980.1 type II toxin-antitoxin system Phd/YefM family antitoxin [Rickettsia endosymbiont of Ixodes persulcatus]MCZ6913526.1 type II toxin-antitoxin syst